MSDPCHRISLVDFFSGMKALDLWSWASRPEKNQVVQSGDSDQPLWQFSYQTTAPSSATNAQIFSFLIKFLSADFTL
jgi:hypothetical protein